MNDCDQMDDRLNDFVDELLPAAARAEFSRHLERCAECRANETALRSLKMAAAALPRDMEPPRDLWPSIAGRLSAGRRGFGWFRGGSPRSVAWGSPLGLAAAALFIVAASVSISVLLVRPQPAETGWPAPAARPSGSAVLASYRAAENEYVRATEDMMTVLQSRRDELSPETITVLDENLRVIDEAIRLMWTAIETDPGYALNRHLFTNLYQKKVMLLQQAIRLPSQG